MKWEILIISMPERLRMREQLTCELDEQVLNGSVRIRQFESRLPVGEARQNLLNRSEYEYISFFDDDDWPAPDYVSSILPHLDGVDVVSFDIAVLQDYQEAPTIRGPAINLNAHRWHLFPMRRELAILEPFEGGPNEDSRWTDRMKARDVVKTEHYIAKPLYYYLHRAPKWDSIDAQNPHRLKALERIHAKTQNPQAR